jgi:hypothetical protein
MNVNAEIIKTAVISYYRYQRQMICTDEAICYVGCETCDVLVDSGSWLYDIEIKVDKYDLWKGEAAKRKHKAYRRISDAPGYKEWQTPNYFIMCVPEYLLDEAQKWVQETNSKYGIIEFSESTWERMCKAKHFWRLENLIRVVRSPKKLHFNRSKRLPEALVKRLCSAYCNIRQKNPKF